MLKTLSILFALLTIGLGVGVAPAAAQGRPDCSAVLRAMHKVKGHGSHRPDSSDIASQLQTDSEWVETCATSYGRHLRPAPSKHTEDDAELTPDREEKEYEEVAREEADEFANRVQGDLRSGVYATKDRGIDPDSSAEWEPFLTHEWEPYITHEWAPFIHDDDDPGME